MVAMVIAIPATKAIDVSTNKSRVRLGKASGFRQQPLDNQDGFSNNATL
jgi:hypothetical protein